MIQMREAEGVYAKLSTECAEHPLQDAGQPKGKEPSVRDVITIHYPLRKGSKLYQEVEGDIAPGLDKMEERLDDSDDEKPGSYKQELIRRGWEAVILRCYELPEANRGLASLTLIMREANLVGKPSVHVYKGLSVLRVRYRGVLEQEIGTEVKTCDNGTKRRMLHSRVWITMEAVQAELPFKDAEGEGEGEGEEGGKGKKKVDERRPAKLTEDLVIDVDEEDEEGEGEGEGEEGKEPTAAEIEAAGQERLPIADQPKPGPRLVASNGKKVEPAAAPVVPEEDEEELEAQGSSKLPEHTFKTDKAKQAAEAMETAQHGFTWRAIQLGRARTGREGKKVEGKPVELTWKDLEDAAEQLMCDDDFKAIRRKVTG